MKNYIIRKKEDEEYVSVKGFYGNSSLSFTEAYMYMRSLPENVRNELQIVEEDTKKVINVNRYDLKTSFLLFLDMNNLDLKDYVTRKIGIEKSNKYPNFMSNMTLQFENETGKDKASHEKEFEKYLKIHVIGDLAYKEEKEIDYGIGSIISSNKMNQLLHKYNITKDEDVESYDLISKKWDKGVADSLREKFQHEIVDEIPKQYREKYISQIGYNEELNVMDNYRQLSTAKSILKHINEIESNVYKLKVLVSFSENTNFKNGEILSYEQFERKADKALDQRKADNEIGYDKTYFYILIDSEDSIVIHPQFRYDIGDYDSFESYLKNSFNNEFIEEIQSIKSDVLEQQEDDELWEKIEESNRSFLFKGIAEEIWMLMESNNITGITFEQVEEIADNIINFNDNIWDQIDGIILDSIRDLENVTKAEENQGCEEDSEDFEI